MAGIWFFSIIFAIFLGGCALFGASALIDKFSLCHSGRPCRIAATAAWCVALFLFAVFIFLEMIGFFSS